MLTVGLLRKPHGHYIGKDFTLGETKIMNWIGPFTIVEVLDKCLDDSFPRAPEGEGVYVISQKCWRGKPTKECIPLYVGSNTGKTKRFRTRIGDLIADVFGFFGEETGHHSGGISLHRWCRQENLNPKNLYIGWLQGCNCVRCSENSIYDLLKPIWNLKRPQRCRDHKS
ncbi:MAG TPA: hypothetical protein VJJ98_05910 [Sedimentisphaerales bacterium]|nr:hypothetical protein [Sedimentisphaerales bacterium]